MTDPLAALRAQVNGLRMQAEANRRLAIVDGHPSTVTLCIGQSSGYSAVLHLIDTAPDPRPGPLPPLAAAPPIAAPGLPGRAGTSPHDPLCICNKAGSRPVWCECTFIAEVRADERAAIMARVSSDMSVDREKWTTLARSVSREQALADLRANVKALRPASIFGTDERVVDARADGWDEAIDAVLNLIDGGE